MMEDCQVRYARRACESPTAYSMNLLITKNLKLMNKIIKIAILLVWLITYALPISAKVYMGKISIKVGESYTVSAVPTYGYTASGYWKKSNSHFVITASGSYNCIIKGNTVGSATLSYWGTVAPANSWNTYTYDYYWDVEVTGNGGSSGSGSSFTSYEEDDIEEPTDDWGKSGNYAISWYNKNQSEFTISSNKELAGMAYLINNGYTEFEGCTIKLINDIDLSNKKWKAPSTFKGTFDGQGHKISGVFIGTDEDTQLNFGFWKTLSEATVVNLNLEGTAKYEVKKSTNSTAHAGGLVGEMSSGSLIQNCQVNMDIYFRRGQVSTHYPGSGFDESIRKTYTGSYVGGIVGLLKGNIKNSVNLGNIRHYVREASWVAQGVILGGISGYCYDGTRIEYCENLSPLIKVVESDVKGTGNDYIKWISGISYNGNPKCCRSVIGEIYVDVTSHEGKQVLYLSGIAAAGKSTNCYSVNPLIILNTMYSKARITYGGIAAYKKYASEPQYCFSNNDIYISNDVSSITIEDGLDGSESFTSEQMKTAAFAEELNMYSILEMDGPVWKHDEGEYPYINAINEATAIEEVKVNKTQDTAVYSLSGQRLQAPKKGINIIGGRKVVMK